MSQSGSSPAEQLAFLRSLAAAGQDAQITAGPYLVAGGAWFGVASLFHWAVSSGLLDLEPSAYGAIWIAAALGFGINLFLLVRRDSDRPESGSNRALNAVWTAIGYSMFVAWVSLWLASSRTDDYSLMNALPLYILAVYGAAWSVAGMLTGQRWIRATAIAAFASAILVGVLIDSPHLMLAYAAALFACALVPGLVMMRRAAAAG